jgi:hypothetical protein
MTPALLAAAFNIKRFSSMILSFEPAADGMVYEASSIVCEAGRIVYEAE